MLKRIFDCLFAASVLVITAPVVLLSMLAVKLTSPGPVLYRARRAGLGGKPFSMLKIRTMHQNADTVGPKITAEHDVRTFRVGRLLRKLKIDELPQFWNVLRGDMSVVGPRPEDWDIVERHYTAEQRRTLEVRPGIFSPVEVKWFPDLTYHDPAPPGVSIEDHYLRRHMPAQLDEALRYVQRHNLLLDIKVIAQIVFCIVVHSWYPQRKKPLANSTPEILHSEVTDVGLCH